ncbi:FAD binding domain-containing protein [Streptomyces sp. ISL-36]|uniref:FAD binding domain-containing protein n=1 Tax=Streptomyces sp. ISL-36 TaxID=2819182 RepID=UPI001BECE8B5|nr:FAD binding domain-containing protein [Streptomyces sp. ISL-36]MBT2442825.1 FAD binding domain-containing protein [Streptomyces sp. ISL-36]
MDLPGVREIVDGRSRLPWQAGDAWLAGGTVLFGASRPDLKRLRDLSTWGWTPLAVTESGLVVSATCTLAELLSFAEAPDGPWPTGRALIAHCCRAFSSSFKVWNTATVGGNLCAALPAGPMISLAVALRGVCRVLGLDGRVRTVPAEEFVTGPGSTVLHPGELLRSVELPAAALAELSAVRRVSTHPWGRSAALVIGVRAPVTAGLTVAVTAATTRPLSVSFSRVPSAAELRRTLREVFTPDLAFEDVHGRADWRRHLAEHLAEEVRRELAEEV